MMSEPRYNEPFYCWPQLTQSIPK